MESGSDRDGRAIGRDVLKVPDAALRKLEQSQRRAPPTQAARSKRRKKDKPSDACQDSVVVTRRARRLGGRGGAGGRAGDGQRGERGESVGVDGSRGEEVGHSDLRRHCGCSC